MQLRNRFTACLAVSFVLAATPAAATPLYLATTGHYYEFVHAGRITWTAANAEAPLHSYQGISGHLATIASQAENDFLFQNYQHEFWEAWLGGWQEPNSAPSAHWHWVTGEPWVYTNWVPGEPNDGGGTGEESYLQMWGFGTTGPGRWNDDANDTDLGNIGGYFVEYSARPVPEPMTIALLVFGLGVATALGRRRA